MPELPEVEVTRRALEEIFVETPFIEKIKWARPDLRFPLPTKLFRQIQGARVLGLERRAKYLLWKTDRGDFVCHLGMTGNFRIETVAQLSNHDHLQFVLGPRRFLIYQDVRRFGFFLAWPGSWEQVTREPLGVEPFSKEWTGTNLKQLVRGKKTPIKTLLMDQKIVVGIGNIYASEVLFRAGVRPQRPAGRVTLSECERIVEFSRELLQFAIEQGGSTISDFRSPFGKATGSFQNFHQVYDRDQEPCLKCKSPLQRFVQAGRSTFWCKSCQS